MKISALIACSLISCSVYAQKEFKVSVIQKNGSTTTITDTTVEGSRYDVDLLINSLGINPDELTDAMENEGGDKKIMMIHQDVEVNGDAPHGHMMMMHGDGDFQFHSETVTDENGEQMYIVKTPHGEFHSKESSMDTIIVDGDNEYHLKIKTEIDGMDEIMDEEMIKKIAELEGNVKEEVEKVIIMKKGGELDGEEIQWHSKQEGPAIKYEYKIDCDEVIDGEGQKHVMIKTDNCMPTSVEVLKSEDGKTTVVIHEVNSEKSGPEMKKMVVTNDSPSLFQDFKIFPNPNDGNFDVSFKSKNKADLVIKVMDLEGKIIHQETRKNFKGKFNESISIDSPAKGFYILDIQHGDERMVRKISVE